MNEKLVQKAEWVRQQAFRMQSQAGKGHLGGAFSVTEILVSLYFSKLLKISAKNQNDPNRDRIILSKGHACLALYAVLADAGFFKKEVLNTYGQNGSILGGHPDHFIPGIEISSGSLGHGLGIGAGLALGAKLDRKNFITFVILGDGECAEGSVWEAANFASSQKLNNLTVFVDNNSIAATTNTKDFAGNSPMEGRWAAFGWETVNIDGHNFKQIINAIKKAKQKKRIKPLAIIANTIKGKGVSFMENNPHWHHGVPNPDQKIKAEKELGL